MPRMLLPVVTAFFILSSILFANPVPHFNPKTVRVFNGKISSVQTFGYATKPTPHKQIILRTMEGEIAVDVGPVWYLDAQGITLMPEGEVEVEGSVIRFNGNYFVIASSITQGGVTFKLREKNGLPVWRRY